MTYGVASAITYGGSGQGDAWKHAHAFVGVGLWKYFRRFVKEKKEKDGNRDVYYCDTSDPSVDGGFDWYIARAVTHELGHLIGLVDPQMGTRFTHASEAGGRSSQCSGDPSVMDWYSSGANVPYFCLAELQLIRRAIALPQGVTQ